MPGGGSVLGARASEAQRRGTSGRLRARCVDRGCRDRCRSCESRTRPLMITRVVHGWNVGGLVTYLMGPGRAREHVNPRVIATWDGREVVWQPGSETGPGALIRALNAPALAAGLPSRSVEGKRGHVWHCSARVAAGDRVLSTPCATASRSGAAGRDAGRTGPDPACGAPRRRARRPAGRAEARRPRAVDPERAVAERLRRPAAPQPRRLLDGAAQRAARARRARPTDR